MFKRILGIILVIFIISTTFVPVAIGAEIQVTSKRNPTAVAVSNYSSAAKPDSISSIISFNAGEWVEYQIYVNNEGMYYIGMYASTASSKTTLLLSVDGVEIGSSVLAPNGSYSDFSFMTKLGECELTKGTHTFRVTNVNGAMHVGSFEVGGVIESADRPDFSRKSGAYKEAYLPTIINAEDFDIDMDGCLSNDGVNDGNKYRFDAPMDIYEKPAAKGDYYVRLNKFEYTKYTFNVSSADIYTVTVKAKGMGKLYLYVNDMTYPVTFSVSDRNYSRSNPINIYFDEGVHSIKVTCEENMVYLDDIAFTSSKDRDNYYETVSLMEGTIEVADERISKEEPDYDAIGAKNEVYKTIYISTTGDDSSDGSENLPFKTIKRAIEEVSKHTDSMTGDIVVSFDSGVYFIDETLKLSNVHSGKNGYNVIFCGAEGNDKTVFSGGEEITGWQKHNDLLWKAKADNVQHVRNLYINDYPAVRARSKYTYTYEEDYKEVGSTNEKDGFITTSINFPVIENPQDLETYWPIWWRLLIHPVADIEYRSDGKAVFTMDQPAWDFPYSGTYKPSVGKQFYLVNAMELLDEPGEFFYNKKEGVIYYYPYKAENMETAKTYIGRTEKLFDIRGESNENKLSNIVFDNISFKYGAWDESSELGYVNGQSDASGEISTGEYQYTADGKAILKSPGQINFNNAENIAITNCEFICLGSTALMFNDSVRNVRFEGNLLRDIAGGGITIGAPNHSTADNKLTVAGVEPCYNFMVRNNVFKRIGFEYHNHTAIAVYYEANINIIHNDISHTPYTGITVGWGWESSKLRSDYHENIRITHNRISDTMERLIDGGPIYTLGHLFGSEIAYNYISDCHYKLGGIYLDAGSSELTIRKNIVEDAAYWFFIQSGYAAKDVFVYDNYSTTLAWNDSGELDNTVYKEPYLLKKGEYPKEALEILKNSGVQEEYKHLLEGTELPSWMKQVSLQSPQTGFIPEWKLEARFGWIQAEDFIPGKQGETYYDNKDEPSNNAYRGEGVGLLKKVFGAGEVTGYVVHECGAGEWITYKAKIPADGKYTFKVNAAHNYTDGGKFNLYVDDKLVIENGNLKAGELGFNELVVNEFEGIFMTEGEHIIKYEFNDGGHFLDAIGFFSDEYAPDEIEETTKNASDFDEGVFEYEKAETDFLDIKGHYAQEDIIVMQKAGIINGIDEHTFAPNNQLAKEQAAWLCMRCADVSYTESNWKKTAEELGMIPQIDENAKDKVKAQFGWIQAENYLPGRYGETYFDIKNKANNNIYRKEGVGLLERTFEAGTCDGYVIHESGDGEWLTYKVRIPEDGEYTFKVNAGHNYKTGGMFNLYVDNTLVIEAGKLPKGNLDWNELLVTEFDGISMTKGEHIIKYEFKDNGHYLDKIGFFSENYESDAQDTSFKSIIDTPYIYDGTSFITREEFAHMLMCAYGELYGGTYTDATIDYKDKADINEKYYGDVVKAYQTGLLIGDKDGNFNPKSCLTRAETVVALRRLLQK